MKNATGRDLSQLTAEALKKLARFFEAHKSFIIAFSGGMDSSMLARKFDSSLID